MKMTVSIMSFTPFVSAKVPTRIWKACLFLLMVFSTILHPNDSKAQNGTYTVSFGSSVSNTTQQKAGITPFAKGRRDTRSQYLYLGSELSGENATAGAITSIAFNVTHLNGQAATLNDVNVYISGTPLTQLVDNTTAMPPSNPNTPNKHYPALTITATGWVTIDLDIPFVWNGTDNILVEICKSNNSYVASNYSVQASQGSGFVTRSRYTFLNTKPDHVPGCTMTTYTNNGNNVSALTTATDRKTRPDLRFTFACNGNPAAGEAVVKTPGTKCFGDTVHIEVENGENTSGLQYQWQVSNDNGLTFTNIDNAVTEALEVTQNIDKMLYRRQTKCGGYSVNSGACMLEALNKWNGTSWSKGTPPQSNESAVIDGDFSCGDFEVCSVVVLSGNMTVQPGFTLKVGKQVVVNGGTLTFEDSASLLQDSDADANLGNIIYKRNSQPVRRFDYTYWSSPVQEQQLFAFSPNTLADKFLSWNPLTNSWFIEPNTNIMQAAKGYIIRAPQTFNTSGAGQIFNGAFIGKPNNGPITTPLSNATQWNLIGNPYPSALDAEAFLNDPANAGVLDGTIYLWTHNTAPNSSISGSNAFNYTANDYATWNLTGSVGGSANSAGNNAAPQGMIAAGQSFMVKTTATGVATFKNTMRSGNENGQFFRSAATSNDKHRLWLQLANAQGFKQALIGYVEGATSGIDRGYDGDAMDGAVVSLYSLADDHLLGIQGLPLPFDVASQVALGFKTTLAGEQQLALYQYDGLFEDQDVFVEDTFTGIIHNLKNGTYSFTSVAGTFNSRFILRFNDGSALGAPTFDADQAIVYAQSQQIFINGGNHTVDKVNIYDLTGRLLFTKSGYDSKEVVVEGRDWPTQVLIVQVVMPEKLAISKKITF